MRLNKYDSLHSRYESMFLGEKAKDADEEILLRQEITKESILIANKLFNSTDKIKRINMLSAINLLTQALSLFNKDVKAARRVLNVARKISK